MAAKGELKGWHVLAIILAFFGVTIGVNAIFITQALKTFPGEDVPKSYVQGLHYNKTLAERAAQKKLGWRAETALQPSAEGAILAVRIFDADGAPLKGLGLTGQIRRPAETREQRALSFKEQSEGLYVAPLGVLAHGGWDVKLVAVRGEARFNAEARVLWR